MSTAGNNRKKVLLKILLIGESETGKTAIYHRFALNNFIEDHKATIGADFLSKEILLGDEWTVTEQIWDTAGQERFQSLGTAFYRGSDGIMFVYDASNEQRTLLDLDLKKRLNEALNQVGSRNIPIFLVGNKADLIGGNDSDKHKQLAAVVTGFCREAEKEHEVHIPFQVVTICLQYCDVHGNAQAIADEHGLIFHAVSAKTGDNIEHIFMDMAEKAIAASQNKSTDFLVIEQQELLHDFLVIEQPTNDDNKNCACNVF